MLLRRTRTVIHIFFSKNSDTTEAGLLTRRPGTLILSLTFTYILHFFFLSFLNWYPFSFLFPESPRDLRARFRGLPRELETKQKERYRAKETTTNKRINE